MAFALDSGILGFNVESEPELEALSEVAAARGARRAIAFRVNPDVDAKTHAQDRYRQGREQVRRAVRASAPRLYALASRLPGIESSGVHMHIGSQITELAPFRQRLCAAERTGRDALRADGFAIDFVNLGGGLGIPYRSDQPRRRLPADYANVVSEEVGELGLAAPVRAGPHDRRQCRHPRLPRALREARRVKIFTIVDAAMNDLMRPTLYEAHHEILPVMEPGPGRRRSSPMWSGRYARRAIISRWRGPAGTSRRAISFAVMTAGAYGAVLASEYNSRLLVPEVLVAGNRYSVTRPRPSYGDMLAKERLPDWL